MIFNAVGVFERGFTPVEEGYLFYPTRWSEGYLVTPTEYEKLVDDWRRVAGFKGMMKLVAIIVILVTIDAFLILANEANALMGSILVYGMVTAMVAYVFWKSLAPFRLVKGRPPSAPPRTRQKTDAALGKALRRPLAVWLSLVSLCFVGWAALAAISHPLWGVPLLAVVSIVAFINIRVTVRAFASKD